MYGLKPVPFKAKTFLAASEAWTGFRSKKQSQKQKTKSEANDRCLADVEALHDGVKA
jgi:hypothetical protein